MNISREWSDYLGNHVIKMKNLREYISESILSKTNKKKTVGPIHVFITKLGEVIGQMKDKKKINFGVECIKILKPYCKKVDLPAPYRNQDVKVYGEYKYGKPVALVYDSEVWNELILLGPDKKTLDKPSGAFRPGPMRRTQVIRFETMHNNIGDFPDDPHVSAKGLWEWIDHTADLTLVPGRQVWEIDPKIAKQFLEALGEYIDTLHGEFFTMRGHKWQEELDELKKWFM